MAGNFQKVRYISYQSFIFLSKIWEIFIIVTMLVFVHRSAIN